MGEQTDRTRSEGGTDRELTIGQVADRSGVATSTLRFYEEVGLIASERNAGGHRRYRTHVLRRVAFIRTAQLVGLSLDAIAAGLASLPDQRTPTARDWERLARSWQPQLDERIAVLTRLRDQLGACIGCGCLSLDSCGLWNPDDHAHDLGVGARYLLSDERPPQASS